MRLTPPSKDISIVAMFVVGFIIVLVIMWVIAALIL